MPAARECHQPRFGDHRFQNLAVDDGHDLIVLAHHDQRFLGHEGQGGQAGPAEHTHKLIHIPTRGRGLQPADMAVFLVFRPVLVDPAIQRGEVFVHEFGINIAARIGHFGEGGGVARHHQHSRRGRNQRQPPGATGVLERKVLRQRAAP